MTTLTDLANLLTQCQMRPLPTPQMAELFNIKGRDLATWLQRLVAGEDPDGAAKLAVKRTMSCAAPYTRETLAALGIEATLRDVLAAADTNQGLFADIRAARDHQDAQAIERLRKTFAEIGTAVTDKQPPAPSQPSASRAQDPDRLPEQPGSRAPHAARGHTQEAPDASPPPAGRRHAQPGPEPEKQFEAGEHVYGGSAALTFTPALSRKNKHVVMIDAALARGTRDYDWDNKICLQMSPNEMLTMYAVLRGWLVNAESGSHGEANDKSFSIEDQGSKFFFKVTQKGAKVRAVPVTPQDGVRLALLLARQIVRNDPILKDINGVNQVAKMLADRLTSRGNAPQAG